MFVLADRIRAILGMSVVILISRLLGLGRELVVAARFGTSHEFDLYLIALMFPALAYSVINFASYYLLVPFFTQHLKKSDSDNVGSLDWREVWPLVNHLFVISVALTAILAFAGPFLVHFWLSDLSATEIETVAFYSRMLAAMVMLGVVDAFLRAVLNTHRVFAYTAGGPVIENIVMIGIIVGFTSMLGVGAIAYGMLAGMFFQNMYLLARVMKYRPLANFSWSIFSVQTKTLLISAGMLVVVELINRSYFLIDRYVALPFGEGIVSALNYGQIITQLPDSVIGLAIASVLFPLFADSGSKLELARFGDIYRRGIIGGLFIALPMALICFVFSHELVFVLLHRGNFDLTSVEKTGALVRTLAPTVAVLFVISTSIRACYSLGMTKTILWLALGAFVVKGVGSFALAHWLGYPGIGLATTLATTGYAVSLVILIVRRLEPAQRDLIVRSLARLVPITAVLCAITILFKPLVGEITDVTSWGEMFLKMTGTIIGTLGLFALLSLPLGLGDYVRELLGRTSATPEEVEAYDDSHMR
jgi:putative peptidoglycan lipid II flippase